MMRTAHATTASRHIDYSQITNHYSLPPNAGVVQWQNGSFPSCTRGFDSPHPLPPSLERSGKFVEAFVKRLDQITRPLTQAPLQLMRWRGRKCKLGACAPMHHRPPKSL